MKDQTILNGRTLSFLSKKKKISLLARWLIYCLIPQQKSTAAKKIKEKPSKTTLDIEQRFSEPAFKPRTDRPAFGARGGRGGNRGGARGGRGGASQRDSRKANLNVADSVAFPSLGSA